MQATIVFEKIWEAINAKDENGKRKYRYIINTGSSRSSKTFSILQSHYLTAFSKPNYRISIWRETKQDVKNTVLADFKKALPNFPKQDELIFNKTESIYYFPNGATIEICGGDDDNRVHGFQGDVAHFNEPYKMPKDVFDQIDMRTSDYVIIDWNPRNSHWIDDLSKQDNAIVIHSTFRDNPFVPEMQRLKILSYDPNNDYNVKMKTADSYKWSVYGLGEKAEKPNRIFSWKKITRAEYDALDCGVMYGVDWGKVDPWGIVEAKFYDGTLYLRELNYKSENELRKEMNVNESIKIGEDVEGTGIVVWLFERLGISKNAYVVCDNNRPLKIAALRRHGWEYAIPAEKPKGSIIDGISLLENIPVCYTDDSPNIEYEEENYSWKTDRYGINTEEPEDVDNHTIDPTRYIGLFLQSKGLLRVL